ncbi:GNAT family N-acetyltransferase [Neobacillus mesonae]|nr:GNAT family N-acetyltransferase [Neobacillus mesonae]
MSLLHYFPMTRKYAIEISEWTYEEPYALYSMERSEETVAELLNGDYNYVLDAEDNLVGFICTGQSARVPGGYTAGIYEKDDCIDLGLGLDPKLTGQGLGLHFIKQSMNYIQVRYRTAGIRLVVAAFNERARTVYERAGFVSGPVFKSKAGGQEIDFIAMLFNGERVD